ncbi:hypothetical protein D3C71_1037710 [compost metagenome]
MLVPLIWLNKARDRCDGVPTPLDPAFNSLPFAALARSSSVRMLLLAGTTTRIGVEANSATGFRSLVMSNRLLSRSKVAFTECVMVMASSVLPSGAARDTCSAPIIAPAPGRFSTTTVTPRRSPSCWPTRRAMTSVNPPGGNGTTYFNTLPLAG